MAAAGQARLRQLTATAANYLRSAYGRRTQREKSLILVSAALAAVFAAWIIATDVADATRRQASLISTKERVLAQVTVLSLRYQALKNDLASVHDEAQSIGGSSLFAELEAITTKAVSRDKITGMNPSLGLATAELQEEVVDITISGVTLRNLVELLYRIEKENRQLNVARLRIKKRFNNPYLFDVQLTVSRLRPRELTAQ